MIYITGDTHGVNDFSKLLDDKYKKLSKDGYVVICGDCGVNILARRNHHSGKLETGIPDAGNRLNSA